MGNTGPESGVPPAGPGGGAGLRRACMPPQEGQARMIGVLVSGTGTNLQALLDAGLPVVAVASSHPGVRALDRARHLPTNVFELSDYRSRAERDEAMASWLEEQGVELVVCAGYM